jgi:hypothetical protein
LKKACFVACLGLNKCYDIKRVRLVCGGKYA